MFFKTYPKAFDEAAEIDGAGKIKVFLKIAMPMAIPAVVVSLIFSFVWNWNETFNISLYNKDIQTLPMQLNIFVERYRRCTRPPTAARSTALTKAYGWPQPSSRLPL